jgi:hypothetical protein
MNETKETSIIIKYYEYFSKKDAYNMAGIPSIGYVDFLEKELYNRFSKEEIYMIIHEYEV